MADDVVDKSAAGNKQTRRRVTFRVDADEYAALEATASARGMSISEYCAYALERVSAVESGDYDIQDILVQRENQLIDLITSQSVNIANLERLMTDSFEQLLGLTRGDSYLYEGESGELF